MEKQNELLNLSLKYKIEKESKCRKCISDEICCYRKNKLCLNYEYNKYSKWNCFGCKYKYIRYNHPYSIPCFKCRKFKLKT